MSNELPDLAIPIGEVVKAWRESHGWSATEYAKRARLSKGYVSEVERLKIAQPKPKQLARLAEPLGLTEWDLISRRMPPGGTATFSMTGIHAAPLRLGKRLDNRAPSPFGVTIATILEDADLDPRQRDRAERLVLALSRTICTVIKREAGSDGDRE